MSDDDGEGDQNGECEQAELEVTVADRSKCIAVRACGDEDESAADLARIVRDALDDADSRANQGEGEQERCFQ